MHRVIHITDLGTSEFNKSRGQAVFCFWDLVMYAWLLFPLFERFAAQNRVVLKFWTEIALLCPAIGAQAPNWLYLL